VKKDIKEIKRKPVKELYKELKEAEDMLLKLRLEVAQAKVKNHRKIPQTKRKIARILTIIQEKQWEEFEKQSANLDDSSKGEGDKS